MDKQQVINEPDLGSPESKMHCDMDKAMPSIQPEVLPESLVGTNKVIVEPSIASLQAEISTIEKQISELEKSRDKIITEKHKLLTNDGDFHSIESLHKKEKGIEAELAELSKKLSGAKQSLNWKLQDKENYCLALSELARYEIKTAEAITCGGNVLGMIRKINEDISLLKSDAKQFTPIQQRRYDESMQLLKNLQVWGISNPKSESGVQYCVDFIRNDTSPVMQELKNSLYAEIIKTRDNLLKVESILWDIERVLNFARIYSGTKPPELPTY